jgi:hypothetical protein
VPINPYILLHIATLNANVAGIAAQLDPQLEGYLFNFIGSSSGKFLYTVTFIFIAITAVVVTTTFIYLYIKKKTFFYKKRIHTQLTGWITKAILEEIDEDTIIPIRFKKIIRHPIVQQFVINELVATKKSLMGISASNIVLLYLKLNLKKASVAKMESHSWQKKAMGIQELYMMDQHDMLLKIYRLTNSKNEFIRTEAQTGIVHLSGFKGLRFLDIITEPITNWHQLKLLDYLPRITYNVEEDLSRWLQSINDTVVIFTLRIIETYQFFNLHDACEKCLYHENENVKIQTIRTITTIGNNTTGSILIERFEHESTNVRIQILEHLSSVANKEHIFFLLQLQNQADELISLKAAKALAKASPVGLTLLEIMGLEKGGLQQKIFLHVQSEIAV